MKKPIIIALIISMIGLWIVDLINSLINLEVWQALIVVFLFFMIIVYSWKRFLYARDQKSIFGKDYIIALLILFILCLVYAYCNSEIECYSLCLSYYSYSMITDHLISILGKCFIILFFVYNLGFVLQLPEKNV